jgi:hypothetical protein
VLLQLSNNTLTTGILNITSEPSSAIVYIEGVWKGYTPLLITVQAGLMDMKLLKSGYQNASDYFDVSPSIIPVKKRYVLFVMNNTNTTNTTY